MLSELSNKQMQAKHSGTEKEGDPAKMADEELLGELMKSHGRACLSSNVRASLHLWPLLVSHTEPVERI